MAQATGTRNANSVESTAQYPFELTRKELDDEFTTQMKSGSDRIFKDKDYLSSYQITQTFTPHSLSWVVKNGKISSLNEKQIGAALSAYPNMRLMKDNKTLLQAVNTQISPSLIEKVGAMISKNLANDAPRFGYDSCHQNLTSEELDYLSNKHGKLWQNNRFLDAYFDKLMPSKMLRYERKDWDMIPVEMRENLIIVLYNFVMDCINNNKKLTDPTNNGVKGCILWKYINHNWTNYVEYCIMFFLFFDCFWWWSLLCKDITNVVLCSAQG